MTMKTIKDDHFASNAEGDREAMEAMIVELEQAIVNVRSGQTTAMTMIQVQMTNGQNVIDLVCSLVEGPALLQGLRDAWERVFVKHEAAKAAALDNALIVWVDEEGELAFAQDLAKGTIQ